MKMRLTLLAGACAVLLCATPGAQAALHTEAVSYQDGDAPLEGYLAYDDAVVIPRPGVLVVHEWKGLGEYAKHRAEQLAQLGYVAFAVDMYGKGIYAKDHEEAGQLAGAYFSDRSKTRQRIRAAMAVLQQQAMVDPSRIAAIGYCFGGMTVLELARSGAPVAGVASFHGALSTPQPAAPQQIKGRVLVFHGALDQHVTAAHVAAFKQEMQEAAASFRVVVYEGAAHSFTVPDAGSDVTTGRAYHAEADRDSWQQLEQFLREIFGTATLAALSDRP